MSKLVTDHICNDFSKSLIRVLLIEEHRGGSEKVGLCYRMYGVDYSLISNQSPPNNQYQLAHVSLSKDRVPEGNDQADRFDQRQGTAGRGVYSTHPSMAPVA